MRDWLISLLVALVLALASVAAIPPLAALMDADPSPEDVCWEDEPCFDCMTMGNARCGPTTEEN